MATHASNDLNNTKPLNLMLTVIPHKSRMGALSLLNGVACVHGCNTNQPGITTGSPASGKPPVEDTMIMPYIIRRSIWYRIRRWIDERIVAISYILCLIFCGLCWYGVIIIGIHVVRMLEQ